MANPMLIGALLGGIEGGAKANYQQVMKEAEEERKMSYQKLLQQYAKDNIVLQDELATKRQEKGWDREDANKVDQREYDQKNAQIAALDAEAKENKAQTNAWDIAHFNAKNEKENTILSHNLKDAPDRRSEFGKLYDDMKERGFTDEQINSHLAAKSGGAKGALTENQKLDLIAGARAEYQMDPESREQKGGFFGKDKPSVPFGEWLKTNQPEVFEAVYGASDTAAAPSKGLVNDQMAGSSQPATPEPTKEEIAAQQKSVAGVAETIRNGLKPGAVVEQKGKTYIVNDSGIPVEQKSPGKSRGAEIVQQKTKDEEYSKNNPGIIAKTGLSELANVGAATAKEIVRGFVEGGQTVIDVYRAFVGEPAENVVNGLLTAQGKSILINKLESQLKMGVISQEEFEAAYDKVNR